MYKYNISFNSKTMTVVKIIPYERSFASHEKAEFWHPTKNGDVIPRNVFKSTHTKYWFYCNECNHDFYSNLNNMTCHGNWCPYCSYYGKILCKDIKCNFCFNKSFASQEKAEFWHPTKNEDIMPRDVLKSTNTKYWFKCNICNHDFDTSPAKISDKKTPKWCRYCSHHLLCNDKNCKICFNNSFASHGKAQYWHPTENGEIMPRDIFKSTNTKYLFKCNICNHDFYTSPNRITMMKSWCPHCVNKTETKMKEHLEKEKENLYIKVIKHHYRPKWADLRKTHNTFYEYDFYIELVNGVKIIIEIDGRQHYEQVSNWTAPLYNQIRDTIKERLAGNEEVNIIRLNQEHIWEDKGNWQQILDEFVKKKYENNDEINIYDACMW